MKLTWLNAYKIEHEVAKIITQQEIDGIYFDLQQAYRHVNFLREEQARLYNEIRPHLHVKVSPGLEPKQIFKKDGELTKGICDYFNINPNSNLIGGPFQKVVFEEPNINSTVQLKEQLDKLGWEPDTYNFKFENGKKIQTSPKLTESSYSSLNVGIGPLLRQYLIYSKRESAINGLIAQVRYDGTISAGADSVGTPTARMRHRGVVNLPSVGAVFGEEVRSLFIPRPWDRVLVGYDAAGLEARVMGHWLNDPELIDLLINPEKDFHTFVWEIVGEDFISSRKIAKNVEYAFIYGAMDKKLGETADRGSRDSKAGKEIRKRISQGIPALGELVDKVQAAASRGWLVGIDGRKLYVRKPHAALNLLFQSTGALIMKKAMLLTHNDYGHHYVENREAIKVLDMHDEALYDCNSQIGELFGKLGVQGIIDAGKHYNLNCPLDGEYKVGKNYAEVH